MRACRDEADPGLPIKLGPVSNGEYAPPWPTPVVREAARRARLSADDTARRLGWSRRRFLLSSMGAAAGLLLLDACSKEHRSATGQGSSAGSFSVSPEATTDSGAAQATVGGNEAIIDVQTHLLDYELAPDGPEIFSGFPQANCGDDDPRRCFGPDHWVEEIFARSDTGVAVLSAVPIVADADPLSIEAMERGKRMAEQLCGDGRVLLQGHAVPNHGPLADALDAMDTLHAEHPVAAWKVYTHLPGPGWSFVDPTGSAFLERVSAIASKGGTRIVSVHKGFSNFDPMAAPGDVGPAARAHPDLNFVVYHSGFETGNREGPYADAGRGVDRLVKTARDAGIGPGGNVYAELGSTWKVVLSDPDQAAHVLGKLLAAFGEDNVMWGTDSIWYGSPQDQIQALRTFEISAEAQERYGYPTLTPAVKAKIFGLNAARLYGIDPAMARGAACQYSADDLEQARQQSALGNRVYGPTTAAAAAAVFRRDHPWI